MCSPSVEERGNDLTLEERLRERIRRGGPITFHEWMRAALYDGREGYYRRRDLVRWGRAGDYRTSPERTPLFASTFARTFERLHAELGSPPKLTIIEAGAGAGNFAHVVMNTLLRDHPAAFSSVRYVVDEASDDSRARAAKLLAPFGSKVEFRRASEIESPFEDGIIFSNELIDAFPVHRVIVRDGELLEMFVGLGREDEFVWVEGQTSTPRLAEHFVLMGMSLDEGQSAEVNLELDEWIAVAAAAVERGFVVTVDYGAAAPELYGAAHRRAGTLRGFAGHRRTENILEKPGSQDITSTVNWTQLIKAGERAGLETVSLEPLGKFLMRAGFLEQLERGSALAEDEGERAALALGAREMILPGGMAESFQVLVQRKG